MQPRVQQHSAPTSCTEPECGGAATDRARKTRHHHPPSHFGYSAATVEANASASAQELLAKQVSKCNEAEISKAAFRNQLLNSAYQRGSSFGDSLIDAAKRYRVDTDKIGKPVAEELR